MRMCEIVQTIDYIDEKSIEHILKKHSKSITEYAFICHDKDLNEKGEYKTPHYHILLHLSGDWKYGEIAKWFDCGENFVGKIKSPRFNSALAYLTHSNAEDKYQYDVAEIKSNISDIDKKIKGELVVREKTQKLNADIVRKNEIMKMIINGEIRHYNIHNFIDIIEYDKFQKSIKNAFEYRANIIKSEVNREMEAIYIYGDSGSGKTTLAKKICEDRQHAVFVSSGSNDVLDGYRGEQAIILDDLRPSCLGLSDLLKMLDNNTASSVKSRYQNKVLECKLIIITTTLEIENFFNNVFSEEHETSIQLQRRCQTKLHLTHDTLTYFYYDEELKSYKKLYSVDNPTLLIEQFKKMNEEQQRIKAKSLLKSMGVAMSDIADNLDDIIKNKESGQQKEKKK